MTFTTIYGSLSFIWSQWGTIMIFWHCFTTHDDACKNSLVKKSGRQFFSPFICFISKWKHDNNACHLAKICFETKFWTSFVKTLGAALQSALIKNFLLNKSSWNFCKHKTIERISFLMVEYFYCDACQIPEWYLTICSFESWEIFCFKIPHILILKRRSRLLGKLKGLEYLNVAISLLRFQFVLWLRSCFHSMVVDFF